jgi:predicted nucleic acid-binding protein
MTGFLRLVTSAHVFDELDNVDDAIAILDAILAMPGAAVARNVDEWPVLRNLLLEKALSGNLITDAWIAAAIQVRGEHLVTFDRDFRRLLAPRNLTILSQS